MSQLNDFIVQIHDKPGVLATRTENVQAHLARMKGLVEAGTIVMSGPTLTTHPKPPDKGLDINGSVWLVRANLEDEVRSLVDDDVYAKLGVWDLDNVVITPFKCAVRKPL
ncbi:uncharacterized protein F4822DRAFT_7456 [Hypoxylon trugodes]|uniref:uncharacterized protein n=1 Tax=Hypoxylon trugodes TaxID=326681 RepID=UPI0021A24331|nr:uncharacterized protein F4822DRAFT_7456 [Hypoxylon trugodes]KAI1393299.1 hypothetical protein F4822DRAFT_7456 [Hypoxylon trugodes]